jgi:pentapeptide repeat protein
MNKFDLAKLLEEGRSNWNNWRKANPNENIDISRLNLSGFDLREYDFTYVTAVATNFSNSDLSYVDFSNADCSGANFENSYLYAANFTHVSLAETKFGGADLSEADLRGSMGLTQDQIGAAIGDDGTNLPPNLYNPWADDYNVDPDREGRVWESDGTEIPPKVVAPLQAYWSDQKLVASLDSPVSSKVPIIDAAHAVADRLSRV